MFNDMTQVMTNYFESTHNHHDKNIPKKQNVNQ